MNVICFRRNKRVLLFVLASSYFSIVYLARTFLIVDNKSKIIIQRVYSTNINFPETDVIDTNTRWQKLGRVTYIFTAYLDNRSPDLGMITVMGFDSHSEPPLNGTLLFDSGERIPLGRCKEKRGLNVLGSLERLQPYAYLWPLPAQVTNSTYLSLKSILIQQFHPSAGITEAEIKLTLPVSPTKTFGVCLHSPLFGEVKAETVIEYIEINKVLGAEWFTFYVYKTEQTVIKVLQEYANEGTVEVVWHWGESLPEKSISHFGQTLSINECAYRNSYKVKYLVYTDLDEFILPRKSIGWTEMMKQIGNDKYGSYMFRNVFFFEINYNSAIDAGESEIGFTQNGTCRVKLPKILTHRFRSTKVWDAGRRSKYIKNLLCPGILLVHQVRHQQTCRRYVVPPDYALLNHYRKFRKLPVQENAIRHQRIPDEHAFVYQEKIIAALNRRLCRSQSVLSIKSENHVKI